VPYGSLIICATPRTGSTLLCDLLKGTGVAGRPNAFYRRQSMPDFARQFGVSMPNGDLTSDRAYLAAALREGTGDTGTFGFRLMWPTVPELSVTLDRLYPGLPDDVTRFERAFGSGLYIHLSRQDRVAQAVSRLKAEQSGLWHVDADGTERERTMPPRPPRYDAEGIADYIAETEAHEVAWADWFARNDIAPFEITYETLSADPQSVLAGLLAALGRDPAAADKVEVRTARLADAKSRAWAERFRQTVETPS